MAPTLDELWEGAPPASARFAADLLEAPEPARRYLRHAIADGAPLADAVRLRMHGEIKLAARWRPFTADQVLRWDRGMIWRASVKMGLVSVRGFDRVVDGEGEMRWKLLGLIPIVSARGADVTRSGLGRMHVESIWLPSVFVGPDAAWLEGSERDAVAELSCAGVRSELRLGLDASGGLRDVATERWGQPDPDQPFRSAQFGGVVEAEATFAGYTIPTQLRAGWHYGGAGFDEGEFFRVTVDEALYK